MYKGKQGIHPVIIIFILAAVCVATAVGVLLLMGYRYITNDEGYSFIGKVVEGQPVKGRIKYPDGRTATLDYYNNTIEFSNGNKYVGDIYKLYQHGEGKLTYYATGDVYEGTFEYDKLTGHGKYVYKNGDYYEGDIVDGKMEGHGKYVWADGTSYEGEYKNGMYNGRGTYTYASAEGSVVARYTGDYVNGMKHGEGTYYFDNGNYYTGSFENDKINGKGTFHWANGESYIGTFIDSVPDTRLRNSNGEFILNDDGSYVHGEKAVYTWPNGRSYTGYFENGRIVAVEE
ncbi:MAG: hypothetical protein J6U75_07340 [Clostridia bacterium]|nr:hypothetical protein [Clostridia bacterium]MBO7548508.1 hypothetical protein [Clostridia bacterium]MBP5238197.1 hypothetical protein [Clostridia bacterium]MBP5657509.1 hypothetical protein [Clostridia bacterium]